MWPTPSTAGCAAQVLGTVDQLPGSDDDDEAQLLAPVLAAASRAATAQQAAGTAQGAAGTAQHAAATAPTVPVLDLGAEYDTAYHAFRSYHDILQKRLHLLAGVGLSHESGARRGAP